MKSEEYRNRKDHINHGINNTVYEMGELYNEVKRVHTVMADTRVILDDLDAQFSLKTGLTKLDSVFLFTAIGLQILRQYLLTKFSERMDDQTAADRTKGHYKESSNRKHSYYNPSLEEILTNPVPFDANVGSNGALKGGGTMGHRVTAIGHDPILGLIFGTANISTSTLTTSSFQSYHIYTDNKRDCFKNKARTQLVLGKTVDKLINCGIEGKKIVAVSLMKEVIHLRSDLNTKNSLPLPIISVIDPKTASELASYGLDMANVMTVGKQAVYATLINTMIAMIHGLFYDGVTKMDKKLYEVRTRKILSYSNLVASSTSLALVAVTGEMGSLDLGGLAVTIYRLITDKKFINQVKRDFIFGSYQEMIMGDYASY